MPGCVDTAALAKSLLPPLPSLPPALDCIKIVWPASMTSSARLKMEGCKVMGRLTMAAEGGTGEVGKAMLVLVLCLICTGELWGLASLLFRLREAREKGEDNPETWRDWIGDRLGE